MENEMTEIDELVADLIRNGYITMNQGVALIVAVDHCAQMILTDGSDAEKFTMEYGRRVVNEITNFCKVKK